MTADTDFAETKRARLQADLRDAMKRRDAIAVSTLRCLIGAIDNAGAVDAGEVGGGATEVARRLLTAGDVADVLAREWLARETAAATLERHGRDAATPRAEMAIVANYLAPNADPPSSG
jgi:uncharacterized protein YqeY